MNTPLVEPKVVGSSTAPKLPTPDEPSNKRCKLLSLPRELRDEIYSYAIEGHQKLYYGRKQRHDTSEPPFVLFTTTPWNAAAYGNVEGRFRERPSRDLSPNQQTMLRAMINKATFQDGDQLRYVCWELYKETKEILAKRETYIYFFAPSSRPYSDEYYSGQNFTDMFDHYLQYFPPRIYKFHIQLTPNLEASGIAYLTPIHRVNDPVSLLHPIIKSCRANPSMQVIIGLGEHTTSISSILSYCELAIRLILAFRGEDLTHLLYWNPWIANELRQFNDIERFRAGKSVEWLNVPNLRFRFTCMYHASTFRARHGDTFTFSPIGQLAVKWHQEGF